MSAPSWADLEALFHDALARAPAERAVFLAERCAGRPDLHAEVEALLRTHEATPEALELPTVGPQLRLTPGARVGPYALVGEIGAGAMGEVYRARDAKLGRDVAIKILPLVFTSDPERRARFEREARMLGALNHPHIGAIYGFEDRDDIRALVLELVEGPTLADRLANGPIPAREALNIARQIADALDAAHEKGIVHRDLKPANIKVTGAGVVKVLDFGLAKALASVEGGDLSASPTITVSGTRQGMILGTAAYMSPEQARGQAVDKRTDIWAFGCVLYEMLTGRAAFPGKTLSDTIATILGRGPDWEVVPPTISSNVRRLLQRCLEKDLARRLHDIADARLELDDALTGNADQHASVSATFAQRGRRRERLAWTIAALAGLSLVAMALFAVLPVRHVEPRFSTRFEIATPPTIDPASFAISPDGRQLAFVATTEGTQRLFVRTLDQVAAKPLAGTEGAFFPFWAPDGDALGFFAGGKLRRIDLAGGAPQTLADATGWGAAWSRDGVIVFSAQFPAPLLRVAASGGAPVAVTRLAAGDVHDCWPQFLPDGRRFLFFHGTNNPETTGVYLGSLDGGEPTRVLVAQTMAVYAPPGVLLQVRQGALAALRFDATRGVVSGDPIPVAAAVGNGGYPPFRGAFTVSTAGVLAYRAGGGERLRQLAWFDRAGVSRGTIGPPFAGFFYGAQLSPDGRRVAVERMVTSDEDVWLFDVGSGVPSRFTFDQKDDWAAIWSSDGRRVVFASDRNGVNDLFEKQANGTDDEQLLLRTPESKTPLSSSRDGRWLLYAARDPKKRDADIWALPLVGGRKPFPVLQTPFDENWGEFSPDGKWVAYSSNQSGHLEVYAQSFPGPGGKRQISPAGGSRPRWRPDGRELFYLAPDDRLTAVPIAVGSDGQLEAGAPVVLFPARIGPMYNPIPPYAATPDGRFLMDLVVEAPTVPPITVVLNWDAALTKP